MMDDVYVLRFPKVVPIYCCYGWKEHLNMWTIYMCIYILDTFWLLHTHAGMPTQACLRRLVVVSVWNRAWPSEEVIIVISDSHYGAVVWRPFILVEDDAKKWRDVDVLRLCLHCGVGGGGGLIAWDEKWERYSTVPYVPHVFFFLCLPLFLHSCWGGVDELVCWHIHIHQSSAGIGEESSCPISLPQYPSLIDIFDKTPGRGLSQGQLPSRTWTYPNHILEVLTSLLSLMSSITTFCIFIRLKVTLFTKM